MTAYSLSSLRSDLCYYSTYPSADKLKVIDNRISGNYSKSEFLKDLSKLVRSGSWDQFHEVRRKISQKYELVQFQRNLKFLVEKSREGKAINPLHIINWDLISWSEYEHTKACEWAQVKVDELQSPLSLSAAAVGACATLYLYGGLTPALLVSGATLWGYSWFQKGLNGDVQDDKADSIFASVVGSAASLFTSAGLIRTTLSGALAAGAYKCYKTYQSLGDSVASPPSSPQSAPPPHTPPRATTRARQRLAFTPA